jgi:hypothetical protein
MSKLFDEEEDYLEGSEEYSENPEPEDETGDKKFYRDKIFNNDYNVGNVDYEVFSFPKVDTFYADSNLEDCYDSFEYNRKMSLEGLVDSYFKNTIYGKMFAFKKKIPKQILSQVFMSIRDQFVGTDYTGSEMFISIAEYFGINYETLYENIPSVYREELVRELDQKYSMLKKKRIRKLF